MGKGRGGYDGVTAKEGANDPTGVEHVKEVRSMSVIAKPMESKLKLVVNVTENGKTSAKSRTYGKVKSDAADEAVYNVADALAGLQEHPVNRITRVDETELSETV